jgi:large subunit ribosomal protein L24
MMNAERTKFSIRKNDQVQVIAGREKGKVGKVLAVSRTTGRVTVENVNKVKRHVKPSQKYPGGGILEKELPLHYSNVQLYCSKCNKGTRIGHKFVAQKGAKKGSKAKSETVKVRVCKRCDEQLDAV